MSERQDVLRVNGVELNVLDVAGGAPTLVFLHYWGGSSRTWKPTIEALSSTNRCVAIDFRGWGDSTKEATDYGLETLATDVVAVTEKLGLKNYLIIGHSMGGKVAQLVAARQPAGLKGLILYAPAPPNAMDVPADVRRIYVGLYQTREGAETVVSNLTPHPLSDEYREQIIEDTLRGSPGAKHAWPEKGMIEDIRDKTSKIKVPVHIIAGGDDTVEPEASLRDNFTKVLEGVTFSVIPGVGHIAPLEAPLKLANAILLAQARQ
ncbi:alpha/beta fold hydrolase [Mesorhizobium sp. CO1-1-8]|uniref:alpha/beta fold hydrolase n=1 Tax=Mesorhizobium sp. CO1-1-8 TaxID=2876631 RepID=UPI001CD09A8A|nr:alpha/beta hydrolase [Mesorhizobium sp. CO1-1-8]MBZ9772402.1 alpha/beta hydrolase [Mesorhizobium sp. CO1-1-8]